MSPFAPLGRVRVRAAPPLCCGLIELRWALVMGFLLFSLLSGMGASAPVTIVDLMVVYTPAAHQAAGGETQIESEIQAGVAWANIVFANSRVNARIRLVKAQEVSYAESGSMSSDLARLRNPADGHLDEAHTLRNIHAADLVCLVTERAYDYFYYGLQGPSAANAFSSIQRQFLDNTYYLPVVLSFNFGCQLERPYADSVGAFPFSYGHTFVASDGFTYSTVDALSGIRLPYFSNPDLTFLGSALGVAEGHPDAAHNAKTINLTAPTVAAFRGSAHTTLPPTIDRFYFAEARDTNFIVVRAGTNLTLVVEGSDPDGSIAKVLLWDYRFQEAQQFSLIATITNTPFSLTLANLRPGERRFIAEAVDHEGASSRSSILAASIEPVPPPNDHFTNSITLVGTNLSVAGDNILATVESGETNFGGYSVWYTWTAPADGRLTLSMTDLSGYLFLGLFVGDAVTGLTNVNNAYGYPQASLEADVTAGMVYHFGVYGDYLEGRCFMLNLSFHPQIAVRLAQPREGQRFLTSEAIPIVAEAGTVPPASISRVEFFADNVSVGVLTNHPFVLMWTNATAGRPTLRARAFDSSGSNHISAPVRITVSPANDDLANALPVFGSRLAFASSTRGATLEPDEPVHSATSQSNSVWFLWSPSESGRAFIYIYNQEVPTSLSVYSGDSYSNLVQVGTHTGFLIFPVHFDVRPGQVYQIVAAGHTLEGSFTVEINTIPHPGNDDFASAAILEGASISATETTVAATAELGEPNHADRPASHSVWLSWTAPRSGNVEISVAASGFTPLLAVYTGSTLAELLPIIAATNHPLSFTATEGTTYRFAIDGLGDTWGPFSLILNVAPPNDHFTNRMPLSGFSLIVTGANVAATVEPSEPVHGNVPGGKSIWWSWLAPADGCVQVGHSGSIPTSLAVYSGSDLTNLTLVIGSPERDFHAAAGQEYHIAIAGADSGNGPAAGEIVLTLTEIPTPSNDNFTNRLSIIGTNFYLLLTNNCATRETNEPAVLQYGHSVWYTWTAPRGGFVRVRSYGYWTHSTLGVYQGTSLSNIVPIGTPQDEFWYFKFGRAVSFDAIAGSSYIIGADNEGGISVVWLELSVPPNNDWFGARVPLTGTNVTVRSSNRGARAEFGEPMHAGRYAERSVWWSWIAPADGVLQISATTGEFQPRWAAYSGTNFATLVPAGFSDPYEFFDPVPAVSVFRVREGAIYQIAVDTGRSFYPIFDGIFDLTLSFHPNALNDHFIDAVELVGADLRATATTGAATREPNEPGLGSTSLFGSLWWRWIAPEDGSVNVDTTASSAAMLIGVYTGDSLTNVTLVTNGQSRAVFKARAGTEYHFAVEQASGQNPESIDLSIYYSQLSLLSPADGTVFYGPTNLVLVAQTSAGADEFRQVDFFHSVWQLASITNQPPTFIWNGVSYGDYLLWVRGTNEAGMVHESVPVRVIIRPANDNFENRTALAGTDVRTNSNMCMATLEPGEPVANAASVWWSWTATTTGRFWTRVWSGAFVPTVYVFLGDAVSDLVSTANGPSEVWFNAVAGNTYQIAAAGPPVCSDVFLHLYRGPANDDFADRLELVGNSITTTGSNVLASPELGEPAHAGGPPRRSVWWTWTAPQSGRLTFGISGTPYFHPWAAVYTGTSLTNLIPVATAAGGFYGEEGITNFSVIAGTSYQIAADGYFGEDSRVFIRLDFAPAPPPPINDDFAQRLHLSGSSLAITGTTLSATRELAEPEHGSQPGGSSVWFTWIAPESGMLSVNVGTAGFTPLLAAYTGSSLSNLALIASGSGALTFNAAAGMGYEFALDGQNGSSGSYSLGLHLVVPPVLPPNDYFTNRIVISGNSTNVIGDTALATLEDGESLPARATGKTLWWSWTAPANGLAVLNTAGSVFKRINLNPSVDEPGPLVAIYLGESITNLTLIASNTVLSLVGTPPRPPRSVWSGRPEFAFSALEGIAYQISVDGIRQSTGTVALALNLLQSPPQNDNFSNSIPLTGNSLSVTGLNWLATSEAGEPSHAGQAASASLWWRWMPTSRSRATVQASGSFATRVAVYNGTSVSDLALVAQGQGNATFFAEPGIGYYIAVDSVTNRFGEFVLNLSAEPTPSNDHLANRIRLHGLPVVVAGSNVNASREQNEPLHAGSVVGASVWYEWTSPVSGTVTISPTLNLMSLAVYAGSTYNSLLPVSFPQQGGGYYAVQFYARAGTTYVLAVADNWDGVGAEFGICINSPSVPPTLRSSSSTRLSDGTFRLQIAGTNGQSFAIQASSNLTDWTTLVIDTMQGTNFVFDDAEAGLHVHRFYRVLPLETLLNPTMPLRTTVASHSQAAFGVRIFGSGGQPFTLEASTNLVDWTSLTSALLIGDFYNFTDPDSSNHSRRFYRAVPLR